MRIAGQKRTVSFVRWVAVGCWLGALPLVGCECEPEPGTDAAVTDAGPQHDAAGTDARRTDSARTDTARTDTHVADTHVADSQGTDTTVTDAGQQDVIVVVDAAGTDTLVPVDAAVPTDSSVPTDAAVGQDANTGGPVFWLTTLITNDMESNLLPTATYGGVARAAAKMKQLQAAAATYSPTLQTGETLQGVGTLTLAGGDSFLAGSQFQASLDHGIPYYDAVAMQEMGFDAIALGNHDFDFGPAILANFIDSFDPTVTFLGANFDFSGEAVLQAEVTAGKIAKHAVITTGGAQVGVISVVNEELASLTSPGAVTVSAIVAAVAVEVAVLENLGINKIVLISHNQSINNDLALIPQLRGIDIFFSAGGHELLANAASVLMPGDILNASRPFPMWATDADVTPVPIITTNGTWKYVGRLVAKFDAAGNLVDLDDTASDIHRIAHSGESDTMTPDTAVDTNVVQPVQAAVAALAADIIAVSEVPLDGRRTNVRTIETNEGNLIADALWWLADSYAYMHTGDYPDVAILNGGGIRNNNVIPAGNISMNDTFNMLPFANFAAVVPDVTHSDFKEILENAVSRVETGEGRFCQISGFYFVWDPSGTSRHFDASGTLVHGDRVLWAYTDYGTPIVQGGVVADPTATLNVATIDFLALGGDGYPFPAGYTRIPLTYQQALADYLVDVTGLNGVVSRTWYPEWGDGRIFRTNRVRTVDYPVIAHGGRLQIWAPLFDQDGPATITDVTIGGVAQTFTVDWVGKITIDSVLDATPLGAQDLVITTSTGALQPYPLTVIHLVINEIDADAPNPENTEFVELSIGVAMSVSLKNYVVVLYNGNGDVSYDAFDLTASTGADGLYLIGVTSTLSHMPDQPFPGTGTTDRLQNGADAIAVYQGYSSAFADGTAIVTNGLIDAVVNETNDSNDTGLLDPLLGAAAPGAVQADEGANPGSESVSIQRCVVAGAGTRLDGRNYTAVAPTPGVANICP